LPNLATKRREGLDIPFAGRLHLALDSVLGCSQLASDQAFSQQFERDLFEPVALKKLSCRRVYC
jgi:hypothetical protein